MTGHLTEYNSYKDQITMVLFSTDKVHSCRVNALWEEQYKPTSNLPNTTPRDTTNTEYTVR